MSKVILRDAFITVDGVNLSNHFSEISVDSEKDEQDVTGFGSAYKEIELGLGDGTITGTVNQDYDAASVDATLWPIHQSNAKVPIVVRPTSLPVGATNPEYRMTGVLPSYSPVSGSVGEPSTTEVSFRNASQAGITRVVA